MIWWIKQLDWMIFVYWEWWIYIEGNKICDFRLYMRYQVDFLLPLKLQKISHYFGLCWKILLANQFAGFFTFDLFDLLILILRVHCYIVLVHLKNRYQNDLELMKGSEFLFDYIYLLYCKCHKINWNGGGSYIYIYIYI